MCLHIDNKKQASEKLQAIGKNAVLCSRNNKNNIEMCRKVIKLQIKFCGIIANIWDENSTQMFFFA